MDGDVLDRAILFATKAHAGMVRKDGAPYILHPLEDMTIVGTMTTDREVLAAAVLHDVIEDTDVTEGTLREEFGDRVTDLVLSETENKRENLPKKDTWKIRKEESLASLKGAPIEEKMLWLGDKLSNIRGLKRMYDKMGQEVFSLFNVTDPALHKWYYGVILTYLTDLQCYPAYRELDSVYHDVFDA